MPYTVTPVNSYLDQSTKTASKGIQMFHWVMNYIYIKEVAQTFL